MPYLAVLLESPTFRSQTLGFAAAAIALLCGAGLLLYLRHRLPHRGRQSLAGEAGSAAALDYVFTMPIFLLTVLLALQFMMLANASLMVHHAAFNAARSARIYGFERNITTALGQAVDPEVANNFALLWAMNEDRAEEQAWNAAALTLVNAAPASANAPPSNPRRTDSFNALPAYFDAITDGVDTIRRDAMLRKADYAFDGGNTRVEVGLRRDVADLVGAALGGVDGAPGRGEWIVEARVHHLYYLTLPIARYLGELQDDGSYRWDISAEVSLL
jgi:hypothetical protein